MGCATSAPDEDRQEPTGVRGVPPVADAPTQASASRSGSTVADSIVSFDFVQQGSPLRRAAEGVPMMSSLETCPPTRGTASMLRPSALVATGTAPASAPAVARSGATVAAPPAHPSPNCAPTGSLETFPPTCGTASMLRPSALAATGTMPEPAPPQECGEPVGPRKLLASKSSNGWSLPTGTSSGAAVAGSAQHADLKLTSGHAPPTLVSPVNAVKQRHGASPDVQPVAITDVTVELD
jgi:hypothetical protein